MTSLPQAEIGIFGGSGFYELLDNAREVNIETPYGKPSDAAFVGEIGGRSIAFVPRHGRSHSNPPAKINYLANLWAMKELGVTRIIGPSACGSLRADVHPGDFVICDQFVDRTWGRGDTYFHTEGRAVTHVSAADPYCPEIRAVAVDKCRELGITVHDGGTVVVINGPRFSTRAESQWFASQGWSAINMTQYPECYLARELEICYANVSLITDYDAGVHGHEPVSNADVARVFNENLGKVKELIYRMVPAIPDERLCACKDALAGAEF